MVLERLAKQDDGIVSHLETEGPLLLVLGSGGGVADVDVGLFVHLETGDVGSIETDLTDVIPCEW